MLKLMTVALALSLSTSLAFPQDAKQQQRAANDAFKKLSQAECTADHAAKWKPAETWVRESDGKVRTSKARCTFDTKAARSLMAKSLKKEISELDQ